MALLRILPGILLGAVLATALLESPETAAADAPRAEESALKAALLFNVARFTRWSDGRRGERLCLLGEDPFGPVIEKVAWLSAERWDERPYAVRRLDGAAEAEGCRIVFIGASESDRLETLLEHPGLAGALIVGDMEGFAERGGTLELTRRGRRMRFAVNLEALCRHRLSISAQALELAIIVGEGRCR